MRTLSALLVLLAPAVARADDPPPFALKDGQKVVFLGDSNTHAGKFITYLDAYLCTRFPDKKFELINLGLPSETVTGLSEPDHPFPRPNVHDRLDRALELAKPDVVVACYGMNDGIYAPFDEERFKKYQAGIQKLIEKVEKSGAKVVLMTPPPFDPRPLKDKLQPKDAAQFSWLKPYEKYDEEVLSRYAAWLLTLRDKKHTVIDLHGAMHKFVAAVPQRDANYTLARDGIHFSADGHLVVALELLKVWNAPSAVKEIVIDTKADPPTKSDVKVLGRNGASFSFFLPRPMPADPAWSIRAKETTKFDAAVNRYHLKMDGTGGALSLSVQREGADKKTGRRDVQTSGQELSAGLDLGDVLQVKPDPKASDLFKLFDDKNRVLAAAWLSHVGHKRPDTPKGLPLEDAKKKATALDDEIRKACQPVEYILGVGPLGKPGKPE